MASFFSWAQAGPTTPAAVLSFLATQTNSKPPLATFDPHAHVLEVCSIASELPSSLVVEFQTYLLSLMSFVQASSTVLIDVATDCEPEDKVASVTNYVHNYLQSVIETPGSNPCMETPTPSGPVTGAYTTSAAPGGAVNGTYPTAPVPTTTGSFSNPGNYTYTTSIVTGAAARPTSILMGAAAVGGVLGAAIML